MKTQIDLKSVLCGLGLGVLIMLAIGATEGDMHRTGRYQCSGGETITIVDTATGQAWCMKPGGTSITGNPPGFFEPKLDK